MECADADTLAGFVAGALTEAERAAIATHAATCSRCHALLDGLLDSSGFVAPASPNDETVGEEPTQMLSLRRGTRVGRYVIDERIGAGGMGVVFAATDSELHRRVAVKLLRPNSAGEIGTQGRERLMREARLLASLSHHNVVTVFDVGAHQGHLFLAMELVDGGNLTTWLRRSTRSTGDIVDRLIEAGRGLAAAHAGGVVHRDVKPDNILVSLDGRARMTDFGLARIDDNPPSELVASKVATLSPSLTKTGALMGTPVYMAPEQWQSGAADARTDQWAFCATLYEAVAGVRPFTVDNPAVRAAEIERGEIAAPPAGRDVPGWLQKIVMRGLRADPAERWSSMDIVVAALVRGRQRRRRFVQGVALAGLIAILGTTIGALVLRGDPAATPTKIGTAWVDLRPGCSCPFSKCEEGKCLSVCKAADFTIRKPVPGINVVGTQQALLGASADHETLLYLTGRSCALDRMMVARRVGPTYVPVDVTDLVASSRVEISEVCCTLSSDARSILITRPDHRGFVRLGLTATTVTTVDDGAEFAQLLPAADPKVTMRFPVLSNDELTIYYVVSDQRESDYDPGPLAGAYASTRTDISAPFPTGRRLTGVARQYSVVSGESSDHLALFMTGEWVTHVLVRSSTSERYDQPAPTIGSAVIPGWRTIPSADCSRVLTTYTPGGCRSEDIVWLEATYTQPRVPYTEDSR